MGKSLGEGTFGKVKLGTHILTGEKVSFLNLRWPSKCSRSPESRTTKMLKELTGRSKFLNRSITQMSFNFMKSSKLKKSSI